MTELKLCTCGEKATIKTKFTVDGFGKVRWYFARCPYCGKESLPDTTEEEAIEIWNRRVKK